MKDAELITALNNKEAAAFRLLVESYQNMVFKACYHILNNIEDAEDIAQEVFVEAYMSIANFRGDSKISTWLYRIAVNKSKNLLRKNKWQSLVQRFSKLIPGEKPDFDAEDMDARDAMLSLEKNEEKKLLKLALDSLPENQRIAFSLNKYEELSYQEISEIMQTSLSAVESLIHRAKLNLQKKLVSHYFGK
jgi:RNA polymerase sigma-70 factor (ECF subfamily)